jgi:4-hydroxyacetophenone monooxygenase
MIVEDDAQIAAALREAHLPTLMTALAYMTGETGLLREAGKLVYSFGDNQGGMSAELQARVRDAALTVLARHRDLGCPALPSRSPEFTRELMNFITAQTVAEHYLPFLREELGLDGGDAKSCPSLRELPAAARAGFRVIVIGAGMSGIAAAVRLRQAGVSFVVLEKNADVGGTWFENTYPGCRVDSPNHLYSFSFEPNHDWPLYYSTHDVLHDYFRRVTDKHGLREHIRFQTSVEEAVWDDAAAHWRVRVRRAGGGEETLVANAVISAVGQLNRPQFPDIPGRERFAGVSFHSARWDHGCDLTGKRVAVIGTGASAFQFIPEVARKTRELLVFQRSAPWVLPTPNYHERVPDGTKWLLHKVPNYDKWYRFFLFWLSSDGLIPSVTADPEWQGPPRAIGPANDLIRKMLKGYIRMHLGQNPELFEASVPDYPPGGKRMLRDNGLWYAALKRDDVRLITTGISSITEQGLVTEDGVAHEVDAIIYGTGFQASRFLQPMRISGRNGVGLNDHWAGEPRAYFGMTIPSFPNLFLLYGPNTNIVVNGSIIFFSECAVRYVLGCIELLLRGGHRAMEVRREPHDRYNERVDAQNARMAWGAPGVRSWYKNASGRVSQNWPFPLVEFWRGTQAPDPADFDIW